MQWGPDLPFLGKPAMRTCWITGTAHHKARDVETNPGPTTTQQNLYLCLLCTQLLFLSAVFCVICSLFMFMSDASGNHMVEMYSSMGLFMALYVAYAYVCSATSNW